MSSFSHIWSAAAAGFLASLVEAIEALTIIIAAATVRGWPPALFGAIGALVLLGAIVGALGPLLAMVPLQPLQIAIGLLLLLFGMRWLRKAILRAGGVIALHDECRIFAAETAELRAQVQRQAARLDLLAGLTSFKAVLLEGLEVVFIVIAVGGAGGVLIPATSGALAACLLVGMIGLAVHRPLARVPENTLKFAVGVILSAFGTFWAGEGLRIVWPGADFAIVGFGFLYLSFGLAAALLLRRTRTEEALP